jgi:aldose 1-epimerase
LKHPRFSELALRTDSSNGSLLDGSVTGHTGWNYSPRAGLCLEPQNFPDAPNHPNFPSCRLEPGKVYTNRVVYKFAAS